ACDYERIAVQGDGLADDGRVAAVKTCPQAVAEDGNRRFPRLIVVRLQQAADQGPRAKHLEQVGRGSQDVDPVRLVETGEVHRAALRDGQILEGPALRSDIVELAGRRPVEHDADAGRAQP